MFSSVVQVGKTCQGDHILSSDNGPVSINFTNNTALNGGVLGVLQSNQWRFNDI